MPRLTVRVPKYSLHKASGKALSPSTAATSRSPFATVFWPGSFRSEASDWGALHSCSESSAVEPDEGQMGNVG